MPTYAYRCTAGHEFETVQRITENPLERCHVCEEPVRRMVFPVGIVFKGSGFYKTDSRQAGSAAIEAGGTSAPAASPSGGGPAAGDGAAAAPGGDSSTTPKVAPAATGNGSKPSTAPAPSTTPAS